MAKPKDERKHPVKDSSFGEWVFRDIRTPFEGALVQLDTWWHTKGGKGVFHRSRPRDRQLHPQCNMNEKVVRQINKKEAWAEFDVEFVAISYVPNHYEYQ